MERPRGRYFEEFTAGVVVTSGTRTITKADILGFAELTGDNNRLHTDPDFARQGPFGRQVAHGLLGASIAVGLLVRTGFIDGTLIAFRELTWKFNLPVYLGDTIRARATTGELRLLSRLNAGAVTIGVEVLNQDGKTVQSGQWLALVKLLPEGA